MYDKTKCFLNIEEAARLLGLVPAYIRILCRLAKIGGAVKRGGKWQISVAGVYEFESRKASKQGG
jgi:hypothetical protein